MKSGFCYQTKKYLQKIIGPKYKETSISDELMN